MVVQPDLKRARWRLCIDQSSSGPWSPIWPRFSAPPSSAAASTSSSSASPSPRRVPRCTLRELSLVLRWPSFAAHTDSPLNSCRTELFEKVIFNLLGNAFKYTLKGSITVKVNYESSKAIVQIIDTGCGIADHELSLIFDRFHRVEGTSRSIGGTGIGLALTLELVKTLGGTLTVESALNKGSTFAVTFPRGSSHLPAAQVDDQPADLVDLPPRAQNSLSIIEDAANWKLEPSPPVDGAASPANSPATGAPVSLAPIATSLAARTPGAGGADDPFTLSADLLDLRDSTILLVDDNADLRQYIGNLLGKGEFTE